MKQTTLTQAIQDLTQDNLTVNMMDTIISDAIDKQFNEVFGSSSKCTLGGFWDPKPVAIDPSVLEQFIPVTTSILERLEHDLAIHDQMYRAIMHDLNPAPYTPYARHLNELISPFSQGSRRSDVHTMYYHGSPI
jgi:hypothetical protein